MRVQTDVWNSLSSIRFTLYKIGWSNLFLGFIIAVFSFIAKAYINGIIALLIFLMGLMIVISYNKFTKEQKNERSRTKEKTD